MLKVLKWVVVPTVGITTTLYVGGLAFLMYNLTPPASCSWPVHVYEATWPLWAVEKIIHVTDDSIIGRTRHAAVVWSVKQCDKK